MRVYANLISNLALLDLPVKNYGQVKEKTYFEKIFQQLLIYDQLPDNDFDSVLREANYTSLIADPAFEILLHNDFEHYVAAKRHYAHWQKLKQDYNSYIEWETKRRNKENPYFNETILNLENWEDLPNFSRAKHNRPYNFDVLYQQAQALAGEVSELTKDYKQLGDKDLFRARVNSILLPSKLVFALNKNELTSDFGDTEISVVNIKVNLDAIKLAHIFLNRLIESLHKIRWSARLKEPIDAAIKNADDLQQKLLRRIAETEKLFMLFNDANFSED